MFFYFLTTLKGVYQMKKALVLIIVMVAVLAVANVGFAEERTVVSAKIGFNATGVEFERVKDNGLSYFLSEARYRTSFSDYYYSGHAIFAGVRKHTSTHGSHPYLGAGIGLINIAPIIDGHIGFEFRPKFLPDFLKARAEAGMSAVFGWHGAFRPIIHVGVGISYDLDLSIFDF